MFRSFAGSVHQPSSCRTVRPHNHRGMIHAIFVR
jgi:hypothetical protein